MTERTPEQIIAEAVFRRMGCTPPMMVDDILKALAEAGWKVMPTDPEKVLGIIGAGGVAIYRAMLDAAPKVGE